VAVARRSGRLLKQVATGFRERSRLEMMYLLIQS